MPFPRNLLGRVVTCLGCRQPMVEVKPIAHVQWFWHDGETSEQTYIQYECQTPDCGHTAQVEAD